MPGRIRGEDVEAYRALRELILQKHPGDLLDAIERLESRPDSKPHQDTIIEEVDVIGADKDPEILKSAKLLANLLPESIQKDSPEIKTDAQHPDSTNKAALNGSGAIVQGNKKIKILLSGKTGLELAETYMAAL